MTIISVNNKPYKHSTHRRRPKRTYVAKPSLFKRSQNTINANSLLTYKTPVRASYSAKFPYGDARILTTLVGVTDNFSTVYTYRVNDMFDPDFTGVGHQPYGFDQIAAMYNKQHVMAVHIEIVFSDPSLDGIAVAVQLQAPNNTNALGGVSLSYAKEMPNVVVRNINNTGSQITKISEYIPIYKLFGVSKKQYTDNISQYAAVVSTPPTVQGFLNIAVCDIQGSSIAKTVRMQIKLTYYARLFERVNLNQS